jgi:hypothetical protein
MRMEEYRSDESSELRVVRALSRGGAFALVAAAALTAVLLPVTRRQNDALVVQAVFVAEPAPLRPVSRPVRNVQRAVANEIAASDQQNHALALRLWTYSPSGQIVFDWSDQYQRCVAARARRREEADCPSAYETRELVVRDGARVGLVLVDADLHRW